MEGTAGSNLETTCHAPHHAMGGALPAGALLHFRGFELLRLAHRSVRHIALLGPLRVLPLDLPGGMFLCLHHLLLPRLRHAGHAAAQCQPQRQCTKSHIFFLRGFAATHNYIFRKLAAVNKIQPPLATRNTVSFTPPRSSGVPAKYPIPNPAANPPICAAL